MVSSFINMENQTTFPRKKLPVAVLAATGAVGQRFVSLLDNHPWFEVVALTGSDRSVNQKYADACHWILADPMPKWAKDQVIAPTIPVNAEVALAFSALPATVALEAEPLYAQSGVVVCSNASAFRREPDVPLLLPEVNPDHTKLISGQKQARNWSGYITTNSNCTITGLTIALKPLLDTFGIKRLSIVAMQAISGAGYPGIPGMDILGNIVPYIQDEEEKMEWEPRKMLGALEHENVELAHFTISAQSNRVPVSEGHMVCLSVELQQKGNIEEVARTLKNFLAPPISRNLPSAPHPALNLMVEPDRPQPKLDLMAGKGMTTSVGRLRPDTIFDYKMVILSHNTIRGAAGGSIYNAELLVEQGLIS